MANRIGEYFGCICPDHCDCQNPEPDGDTEARGAVAHVSMNCPIHNLYPEPDPECPANKHVNFDAEVA